MATECKAATLPRRLRATEQLDGLRCIAKKFVAGNDDAFDFRAVLGFLQAKGLIRMP
jgi:hypothetical protein